MKSGLWILIVVIVAGIIIGSLLKGRIGSLREADQRRELVRIGNLEDSETKIKELESFIAKRPESEPKSRAYYMLAREFVSGLQDTARFLQFAAHTLEGETDQASRAYVYYWLYRVGIDASPDLAVNTAKELLGDTIQESWIYNYMGYDLAERGMELDLALPLCERAVQLAKTREDSASNLDSRGWVYYKKGMYRQALDDLEMAMQLFDQPYEEVMAHLAYAALKAGRVDQAFDTFRSILVMGEYPYAIAILDSLMDARGYSQTQKSEFQQSVWDTRMAQALPAPDFELPSLGGTDYSYRSSESRVSVLNFMSPT